MEQEQTFFYKPLRAGIIVDPTKYIEVKHITRNLKRKIISKKFNFMWLLNILYVLLCGTSAVLISYFGHKYGGNLALLASMYPAFVLGQIASMFIFEPEHEFWNIKYGEYENNSGV